MKSLSKLKLREDHVVKVVKDRVFSLAVHPDLQRLLVAAGDKWGQLGLWNVVSNSIEAFDFSIRIHFSEAD